MNELFKAVTEKNVKKIKNLASNPKIEEMVVKNNVTDNIAPGLAEQRGYIRTAIEVIRSLLWPLIAAGKAEHTVAEKNEHGSTALHLAATKCSVEIVKALLEIPVVRAVAAIKDHRGNTSLHLAAARGHVEIVGALLAVEEVRNNVDANDNNGRTALQCAIRNGHLEVVETLLAVEEISNTVAKKNEHSSTALHYAAARGHVEIVKVLLENSAIRAVVAEKNKYGDTPLHLVAKGGYGETAKALLTLNAVRNAAAGKNNYADTALHLAAQRGHISIVIQIIRSMLLTKPLISEMITAEQLHELADQENIERQAIAGIIKSAIAFQKHYGFAELSDGQLLAIRIGENILCPKVQKEKQFEEVKDHFMQILDEAPLNEEAAGGENAFAIFKEKLDGFSAIVNDLGGNISVLPSLLFTAMASAVKNGKFTKEVCQTIPRELREDVDKMKVAMGISN